jgi:NADH-quinone oxidoreductase subunit A
MTALVAAIVVFVLVGISFLASNLILGWLIRPNKPSPEKGEVYECGESPVGSAWNQFDLRFYVVALLFVIFDVEMAFLFPWAVVFGSSVKLADTTLDVVQRDAAAKVFAPAGASVMPTPEPAAFGLLSRLAFVEFAIFFGILMLGFAYLWHRGDLEWIRSTKGQKIQEEPSHARS